MADSSSSNVNASHNEDYLGTARTPVYNPTTLMWCCLVGLPAFLLFMILYKMQHP